MTEQNYIRFLPPLMIFKSKIQEMNPDHVPSFVRTFLRDTDYNMFLWQFKSNPLQSLDYLYSIILDAYAGQNNFKKVCIDYHLKSLIYPDIVLFVAKDHEKVATKEVFENHGIQLKQVDHAGGTFAFQIAHLSCCLSWMNDMGWKVAAEHARKIIKELHPSYVGILGSCGGTSEDVGKVWFFEAAAFFTDDKKSISIVHPVPRQMKPEALWRRHEMQPDIPIRRDKDHIATVFTTKGKYASEKEFIKEVCTTEFLKDHSENLIHGIEMEVAAIWKEVEDWNKENQNFTITCLPAVKGVSDSGNNAERDKYMTEVIKKGSILFIEYIESQLEFFKK